MNLIFRMIWLFITANFRPKLLMMEASVISLRVLLNDLDTNIHMNNGRYMTIMDLGRVDLIIRTGLFKIMRERGWYPVVGTAKMTYRKPLDPFQKYELKTQILGWDEKWIYLEQDFLVGDTLYAKGIVKTLFLKSREKVPTGIIANTLGHTEPSPLLDPEIVKSLV